MPAHLKKIDFHQNRSKINYFCKKQQQNFRALGAPHGYAPESNHVFPQLIFMPPEFYPMPHFKSINFYQNKPKNQLFLQKNEIF